MSQPTAALKPLLKKHNRFITLLAAMIVFVTFVIKEGKRDNLKDLVDSIYRAESVFTIRSDANNLSRQMGALSSKVSLLEPRRKRPYPGVASDIDDSEAIEALSQQVDGIDVGLDTLEQVYDIVHPPKNVDHILEDAREFVNKTRESIRNAQDALEKKKDAERVHNELDAYHFDLQITSALLPSEMNAPNLSVLLNGLQLEALVQARVLQQNVEHDYENYKRLTYFLYSLGWGLGLLTKVFGTDGAAGED